MKIIDRSVVEDVSLQGLDKQLYKLFMEGWRANGGLAFVVDTDGSYKLLLQEVVKYEEQSK
jgi:hypothetical protein